MNPIILLTRYFRASLSAQAQYPGTTLLLTFGAFAVNFIEIFGIAALFSRFGHVRGWGFGEVALFYGLVSISFGISDFLTRGFDVFGPSFVKTGNFDRLLLRPRSTVLQLMAYELRLTRVGRLAQGALVFGLGLTMTHYHWTLGAAAILAFATAGGVALFTGLLVMQATLAFWTVEGLEVANVLTYGGQTAAQYPMNVYAPWFRDLLIFGVPIGCVTYLPMLAAMGRADPLGSPAWVGPIAPAAGFLFLGVALFTWRFGIARYASSGA